MSRLSPLDRMLWAATVPVKKAEDRATLVSLTTFADQDTLRCFPSHGRIAERAGCSRRTVQRSLERLRDAGLIRWTMRGATKSLLYELTPALRQNDAMNGSPLRHSDAMLASDSPQCSVTETPVLRHSDARSGSVSESENKDRCQGSAPSKDGGADPAASLLEMYTADRNGNGDAADPEERRRELARQHEFIKQREEEESMSTYDLKKAIDALKPGELLPGNQAAWERLAEADGLEAKHAVIEEYWRTPEGEAILESYRNARTIQ